MQVHLDDLVDRHGLAQERGNAIDGDPLVDLRAFHVDALQYLARRVTVAHGRHVAGHGAIAQRHHQLAPPADGVHLLQIVLRTDGAFDQRHVHRLGKLLRIHQRAIDHVYPFGEGEDGLIDIEQRHVAAGTTVQPHGGKPYLLHK